MKSPLLYINEKGDDDFRHDTLRECSLAKRFVYMVDEDDIENIFHQYFRYEEDSELWQLPEKQYAVLPDSKPIVKTLNEYLSEDESDRMVQLLTNNYIQYSKNNPIEKYNPFLEDFLLGLDLIKKPLSKENYKEVYKQIALLLNNQKDGVIALKEMYHSENSNLFPVFEEYAKQNLPYFQQYPIIENGYQIDDDNRILTPLFFLNDLNPQSARPYIKELLNGTKSTYETFRLLAYIKNDFAMEKIAELLPHIYIDPNNPGLMWDSCIDMLDCLKPNNDPQPIIDYIRKGYEKNIDLAFHALKYNLTMTTQDFLVKCIKNVKCKHRRVAAETFNAKLPRNYEIFSELLFDTRLERVAFAKLRECSSPKHKQKLSEYINYLEEKRQNGCSRAEHFLKDTIHVLAFSSTTQSRELLEEYYQKPNPLKTKDYDLIFGLGDQLTLQEIDDLLNSKKDDSLDFLDNLNVNKEMLVEENILTDMVTAHNEFLFDLHRALKPEGHNPKIKRLADYNPAFNRRKYDKDVKYSPFNYGQSPL